MEIEAFDKFYKVIEKELNLPPNMPQAMEALLRVTFDSGVAYGKLLRNQEVIELVEKLEAQIQASILHPKELQ